MCVLLDGYRCPRQAKTCAKSMDSHHPAHVALRKHAYSNILKILPPKKWKFSDKKFWGGSNEYPHFMFLSRNKKNNVYPCKPQFYYIKVGFKGVKIIKACFHDSKLGICSPLKHSSLSNDSVWVQRRPWSECANVQVDLGYRCPHMPEDTFLHGAAQILPYYPKYSIDRQTDNLSKRCRPTPDATKRGAWSVSTIFSTQQSVLWTHQYLNWLLQSLRQEQ